MITLADRPLVTLAELGKLPGRFKLRAFAGPMAHLGALSHLRVVHLTDLHVGAVTPFKIQEAAIAIANAQKPDLIALTGDFVCHSQLYLDQLTELMSRLNAPAIGVLGNHDHWSGADEVRAALKRGGVEVLDNVNTVITLNRQRIQVVGLDDAYTSHADREKAVKGLDPRLPTLGLSHIAEEADGLWRAGVPLVLSGHTHAGQVTLARLHELMLGKIAGHKYVHGLYGSRRGESHPGAVYVGAGVGASVIPLRLGDRGMREVAVFELGVAPGTIEEHHDEQPELAGRAPTEKQKEKRAAAVKAKAAKRAARAKH